MEFYSSSIIFLLGNKLVKFITRFLRKKLQQQRSRQFLLKKPPWQIGVETPVANSCKAFFLRGGGGSTKI
jgi:hypothetical protein